MPNYQMNGSRTLKTYMFNNGFDENMSARVAVALNIPTIHVRGNGQDPATFQRVISEAQAQNVASLLSTTVANLITNAGLVQLPA